MIKIKLLPGKLFECCVWVVLFALPLVMWPGLNLAYELPKAAAFKFLVTLMGGCYAWEVLTTRKKQVPEVLKRTSVRIAIFALVTVWVVTTLFAVAPSLSFWGSYFRQQGMAMNFFYLAFFLLLLIQMRSEVQWRRAFTALWAGFGVTLTWALLQGILIDLQAVSLGRFFGPLGHPSYLGYLIAMLAFPLWQLAGKNKWWYGLLGLAVVVLILTESRGAMVGLFVGAVFYARGWRRWFLLLSGALGLGVMLSFEGLRESLIFTRSVEVRLSIWQSSLDLIRDSWFIGNGLESFGLVFGQYAEAKLAMLELFESAPDRAHNVVLAVLSETGVVGLAAYVFVGGVAWRLSMVDRGMRAALVASFVAVMFGFFMTVHYAILAFLLAYLVFMNSQGYVEKKVKGSLVGLKKGFVVVAVLSLVAVNVVVPLVAEHQASRGLYAAAAFTNPGQSYYNYVAADHFLREGDQDFAEIFVEAGGFFTGYADPFYFLLKGKMGSEEDFLKAVELAPNYPPIRLEIGKFYVASGRCEEAIQQLEKYLELAGDVWYERGTEKSRLFYKHNPNFDEVFEHLAVCGWWREIEEKAN